MRRNCDHRDDDVELLPVDGAVVLRKIGGCVQSLSLGRSTRPIVILCWSLTVRFGEHVPLGTVAPSSGATSMPRFLQDRLERFTPRAQSIPSLHFTSLQ